MVDAVTALPPTAPTVALDGWSLKSLRRVGTLCAWLASEPAATSLDLRASELAVEGAAALGAALKSNRRLARLALPREAVLPVQQLLGHEPVAALRLARGKIGAVAGCLLAKLLSFNVAATSLDLSHNMLGQRADAACVVLAEAVMRTAPPLGRLQTLLLRSNYVGKEGALALASAAASASSTLHTLDLRDNEIGSEAAREMADALSPPVGGALCLTRLRLSGNPMDGAAASHLKERLGLTAPTLVVEV